MSGRGTEEITMSTDQRYAVASLVGYLEGICGSGILSENIEAQIRKDVAMVLAAFRMPSKAECERIAQSVDIAIQDYSQQ